jgi:ferrochelatase
MIETFAENARKYQPDSYDHVLFSFHGLPERQLKKCDHSRSALPEKNDCCATLT